MLFSVNAFRGSNRCNNYIIFSYLVCNYGGGGARGGRGGQKISQTCSGLWTIQKADLPICQLQRSWESNSIIIQVKYNAQILGGLPILNKRKLSQSVNNTISVEKVNVIHVYTLYMLVPTMMKPYLKRKTASTKLCTLKVSRIYSIVWVVAQCLGCGIIVQVSCIMVFH